MKTGLRLLASIFLNLLVCCVVRLLSMHLTGKSLVLHHGTCKWIGIIPKFVEGSIGSISRWHRVSGQANT